MMNILYIILAALGLGFLIFIHELAHYWMARRVGMTVEVFSIGMGKAIYSWKVNNIKWQIGWLPFGGYVKIKGMQSEKNVDVYAIKGGYFSKKPLDRIKVAAIAPIVNIAFAFFLFTLIWVLGGREKPFSEFTQRIGWIDPKSELYTNGIRSGDELVRFNNTTIYGFKDLYQGTMLSGPTVHLSGYKVNYLDQTKSPFNLTISSYPHPDALDEDILTTGILAPASYLLYNPYPSSDMLPLMQGSPMLQSGIQYGDRIFWVDGELVFSTAQLNEIINAKQALLTIERNHKTYLARVPRVHVSDLKLSASQRDQLQDWKYESHLKGNLGELYTLPYGITSEGIITQPTPFLDSSKRYYLNPSPRSSTLVRTLLPGDKIIAIDGQPISTPQQMFTQLQTHQVTMIVETGNAKLPKINWKQADKLFDTQINWTDLETMVNQIGTQHPVKTIGKFKLLNPIVPTTMASIAKASGQYQAYVDANTERLKNLEAISNPDKQAVAIKKFEEAQGRLYLGIALQDRLIVYNPPPYILFSKVCSDIWHTLSSLFTGNLNPKWLAGPVGIVQIMHHGWSLGFKEALFWLGLISLNLGILNLLPIPVLDGGHICFALWEIITKKRLKIQTMERLIIPFVVVLIGFFIFVTYHDLSRLFRGLF